jgi:hypothetical protein
MAAIAEGCSASGEVGTNGSASVRVRSGDKELPDVSLYVFADLDNSASGAVKTSFIRC